MASTECENHQCDHNQCTVTQVQQTVHPSTVDPYARAIAKISQKLRQYNHHDRINRQIQRECVKAKAFAAWQRNQRLL